MEIEYIKRLEEGSLPEYNELARTAGQCRCGNSCGCTSHFESNSVLKEYLSMNPS